MIMRIAEGFLFSEDRARVVLITKNRPSEYAGKIVGVGGKLESGETAAQAICREFREEAGLYVDTWQYVMTKRTRGTHNGRPVLYVIDTFRAFGDVTKVYTKTDETVAHYAVNSLPEAVRADTRWCVPMCLDEMLIGGGRTISLVTPKTERASHVG